MAQFRKYKRGVRTQLTKNFYSTEFDCKCNNPDCKWTIIDLDHVRKLQKLRDFFNDAVIITSGYRCPAHNKAVGGATRSRHVAGDACDIMLTKTSPNIVANKAEEMGFAGVGRYNRFTHIDSRPLDGGEPARWDFRK